MPNRRVKDLTAGWNGTVVYYFIILAQILNQHESEVLKKNCQKPKFCQKRCKNNRTLKPQIIFIIEKHSEVFLHFKIRP
jgi:hypothetical protein